MDQATAVISIKNALIAHIFRHCSSLMVVDMLKISTQIKPKALYVYTNRS